MRWVAVGMAATSLACSFLTNLEELRGDASADGNATLDAFPADAADANVVCDPQKPFGPPALIAELAAPSDEEGPRLSHDELTIYFKVKPSADAGVVGGIGGYDIFTASRTAKSGAFGPTSALSLDTADDEAQASPTGDNLTITFESNRPGTVGLSDLWLATRTTPAAAFGSVANLAALNTMGDEIHAYVMPDGLTLYYASSPGTTYAYDLHRATRTPTTAFSIDTSGLFDGVNTAGFEGLPTVTLDELTLYFYSDRPGGKGARDIWKATRGAVSEPFGSVVNVAELNTVADDNAGWISDDQCRFYFASNVRGSYDLYIATKTAN